MTEEQLIKYFGRAFSKAQRVHSYDLIETFISDQVKDWTQPPDTDRISALFASMISKIEHEEFAFLLCHSGYIPEFYEHDSSQETLYSKLIEILVCEWAKRIGFKDSYVQKQKASKEDVTIQIGNTVIVCDAKSYRLGRSQAAPNVKDTIKKADYEKWQDWWNASEPHAEYGKLNSIGGLITFPSLHRWKGSSDAYLYSTDATKPIVILFYEHLTYFLILKYSQEKLINLLISYPRLFPEPSKNQKTYFITILEFLFGDDLGHFKDYSVLCSEIMKEKVINTIERITTHIEASKRRIHREIEEIPVDKLKDSLIQSRLENENGQLIKQLENIKKFRPI